MTAEPMPAPDSLLNPHWSKKLSNGDEISISIFLHADGRIGLVHLLVDPVDGLGIEQGMAIASLRLDEARQLFDALHSAMLLIRDERKAFLLHER